MSNLELGSQFVWDQVAAHFPEVRLRRWGCLGYCHRCIHQPYVLVDDTIYLEAASPEELWELVKAELLASTPPDIEDEGAAE